MISNKKPVNYKVLCQIKIYTFYINLFFIQKNNEFICSSLNRLKKLIYSRLQLEIYPFLGAVSIRTSLKNMILMCSCIMQSTPENVWISTSCFMKSTAVRN